MVATRPQSPPSNVRSHVVEPPALEISEFLAAAFSERKKAPEDPFSHFSIDGDGEQQEQNPPHQEASSMRAATRPKSAYVRSGPSGWQAAASIRPGAIRVEVTEYGSSGEPEAMKHSPHGHMDDADPVYSVKTPVHEPAAVLKTKDGLQTKDGLKMSPAEWAVRAVSAADHKRRAGAQRNPFLSSAAARRTNNAGPPTPNRQGQARRADRRNPFIEYEDREVRLAQERKWLQEDSVYLRDRREELRHGAALKRFVTRTTSEPELYDRRMFHGPHSMHIRTAKGTRRNVVSSRVVAARTPPAKGPGKTQSSPHGGGDENAVVSMRKLKQELSESMEHVGCTDILKCVPPRRADDDHGGKGAGIANKAPGVPTSRAPAPAASKGAGGGPTRRAVKAATTGTSSPPTRNEQARLSESGQRRFSNGRQDIHSRDIHPRDVEPRSSAESRAMEGEAIKDMLLPFRDLFTSLLAKDAQRIELGG